jgi:hypothetical protein
MKSKWYESKQQALFLRKKGRSIVYIESRLGIPRSTLSGWFRSVKLTPKQKDRLLASKLMALTRARAKAVLWHNAQKTARLLEAEKQAIRTLKNTRITQNVLELALAILYLGEGNKSSVGTTMGSSDPLILKFFVESLKRLYGITPSKIKCQIHIRADQDPKRLRKFWSRQLNLPLKNFTSVSIDKRTQGSATYSSYKGVCVVSCGTSAIQRKLIYLSRMFCEDVISNGGV